MKNNDRGAARKVSMFMASMLAISGASVTAQESNGFVLEEIVVTAQKRAESLQDTPIAITAFTANDLETKGIDDISQIAALTPNLQFDTTAALSGSSSAAVVFLRGVGSQSFQITDDPGVGTYVDGVYVSTSIGGVLDVIDIERIEVLRGPQGTLFGRNTIGGAINITSARPNAEQESYFSATVGNFNRLNFRGSTDLAINDSLVVKISGGTKQADGFIEHLITPTSLPNSNTTDDRQRSRSGDDLGDDNEVAGRVSLLYTPTDSLELYATFDASRVRETSAPSSLVGTVQEGSLVGLFYNNSTFPGVPSVADQLAGQIPGFQGSVLFNNQFVAPDPSRQTFATGPNGTNIDVYGASLTVSYDISENLEFKSISSFRETEALFNRDADGSPLTVTHGSNDFEHEQFSQEFQLVGNALSGKLDWIAGVYYFREDASDFFRAPITFPFGTGILNSEVENESIAAFGQVTYRFSDKFAVTGGIRWTEDEKQLLPDFRTELGTGVDFLPFTNNVNGVRQPNVPFAVVSETFSEVTPRVSVEYDVSDSLLTYASYSEGFKSGGFNGRQPFPRPAGVIQFDPETLKTFEVGAKWQSSNNRFRVNAAAFTTEYDDIQLTVFEGIAPGTQNGGDAEIDGVELEVTGILADSLQFRLAASYLDGEYVRLIQDPTNNNATPFPITNQLANSPEFKGSIGVDYTFPLGAKGDLTLSVDSAYSDEVFNNEANSELLRQPSHTVYDARLVYEPSDSTWKVTLWGKNLGDERIIVSGDANPAIGFIEANFNRPREYGVTFSKRF